MNRNLYELDISASLKFVLAVSSDDLLHHRLVCIQPAFITEMTNSLAVRELEISDSARKSITCFECILEKASFSMKIQ